MARDSPWLDAKQCASRRRDRLPGSWALVEGPGLRRLVVVAGEQRQSLGDSGVTLPPRRRGLQRSEAHRRASNSRRARIRRDLQQRDPERQLRASTSQPGGSARRSSGSGSSVPAIPSSRDHARSSSGLVAHTEKPTVNPRRTAWWAGSSRLIRTPSGSGSGHARWSLGSSALPLRHLVVSIRRHDRPLRSDQLGPGVHQPLLSGGQAGSLLAVRRDSRSADTAGRASCTRTTGRATSLRHASRSSWSAADGRCARRNDNIEPRRTGTRSSRGQTSLSPRRTPRRRATAREA